MSDDEKKYEVGHGKPPKHRQFAKEQSGNPKGRPKGSRNMHSILSQISSRPVTLTEDGRTRKVPLKEAIIIQIALGAVKGDRHCRQLFLSMMAEIESREEVEGNFDKPDELDEVLMKGIMHRMLKAQSQSEQIDEMLPQIEP